MVLKLYYVEWLDSQRGGGWITSDRALEGLRRKTINDNLCKTVGYQIHTDVLTETYAPHVAIEPLQFCGEMTIPKVAILKRKLIAKHNINLKQVERG